MTAANYLRFVTDPFYVGVLRTTRGVALLSTTFCLVLGLPIAYRLARMRSRWKSACMLAMVLPLFVGNVVRMVGWDDPVRAWRHARCNAAAGVGPRGSS